MKRQKLFDLAIIILLGFIPLLWLHGNQIILGHDSGLILNPVNHFLDRLYVWTERFGFGVDQSISLAGFFIHGLEALVFSLHMSVQTEQRIIFVFWFVLPGLTMYYLASKLAKKFNFLYFSLPASVFYMINLFLLQEWFIVERTAFSLYAALPLLLAFLLDWEGKKHSTLFTSILIALLFLVLNGEASVPLFGSIIIPVLIFFVFYLIKYASWQRVLSFIWLWILTFIWSIFLQAYWLWPFAIYVSKSYGTNLSQAGGLSGVLSWVNYVSQDSSFYNLLRLQGIPEWTQNPLHPYAFYFWQNPILLLISFAIIFLAFLPLKVYKEPKTTYYILLFTVMAFVSMIFVAGSHPPFGFFYILLIKFLPGFVAFRSAFYKFASALWFAYAILIGFSMQYVVQKLEPRGKVYTYGALIGFCIVVLVYNFPFLNGMFFDYEIGKASTRLTVPTYVSDFANWSDTPERINVRTLALPPSNFDNKVDAYNWKFLSAAPLTSLITNAPIINNTLYMTDSEIASVKALTQMMKENNPNWQNYAKLLGIQSFVLRKDFQWNNSLSITDNPKIYESALHQQGITPVRNFGQWEVYNVDNQTSTEISSANGLAYLSGTVSDFGKIATLPSFNPLEPVYVEGDPQTPLINEISRTQYLVASCVTCNLQHEYIDPEIYLPSIIRGSLLYRFMKLREKFSHHVDTPSDIITKTEEDVMAFDKAIQEKKSDDIIYQTLQDYNAELNTLESILPANKADNTMLIHANTMLASQQGIVLGDARYMDDDKSSNYLNQVYQHIKSIRNYLATNVWQTTDETHKRMLVSANQSGIYTAYYQPDEDTPLGNNLSLMIDYTQHQQTISSEGLWFNLGNIYLDNGIHHIEIVQKNANLYKGQPTVHLATTNNTVCFKTNSIQAKTNDVFRINFAHTRVSGTQKFFFKFIKNDEKINPLDQTGAEINSQYTPDTYSQDFTWTDAKPGTFYGAICSYPQNDFVTQTEIILSSIQVSKLSVPNLIFVKSPQIQVNQVPINYTKNSQTNYTVTIPKTNQPTILTLREAYNTNWTTGDNSNKLMINGYANGWIFPASDTTKTFTIRYKLQDIVKTGFLITGISTVILLILLIIKKK